MCLTDFHGTNSTQDKIYFLIKKRDTLIKVRTDVKTTDLYVAKLFVIGSVTKAPDQATANCYAQFSRIKKSRKMMVTSRRSRRIASRKITCSMSKSIPSKHLRD